MAFSNRTKLLIVLILSTLCTLAHSRPLRNATDVHDNMMNSIDACWRSDPGWESNRFALANCAKGFGYDAKGGFNGTLYVATDPSDDPAYPKPGTLRYGAVQEGPPVWITFARDMAIKLKYNLIMTGYKTIDGRGAKVEIGKGPCIRVVNVDHVIIHGISLHDCVPSNRGWVRKRWSHPPDLVAGQDGDAITVAHSSHVWIDHCYLACAHDGLIDITHASTGVTVSNNYLTKHNKVMLLGHSDKNTKDKTMKVSIMYNHFGPGLVQRMPRVRFGYAHVVNNLYDGWGIYAIGGSSNPTILSEGNYFVAPKTQKQLTWRKPVHTNQWKDWVWRSSRDEFVNEAYFVPSGNISGLSKLVYNPSQSFQVLDGSFAPRLTADAGPLKCYVNQPC